MRALPFFPQCFSQNSDSCTCPATSSLMDFWLLPGTLPDHFFTPCKSSGPFLLSSERRTHYFVQKRFCVSSNVLRCQLSPASRAESSIYFPRSRQQNAKAQEYVFVELKSAALYNCVKFTLNQIQCFGPSQFVDCIWPTFRPPASHKRQYIVHVKRINSGGVLPKHMLGLCHSLAEGLWIGYLTSLNFSFLTRMWRTIECIHYRSLFYFRSI